MDGSRQQAATWSSGFWRPVLKVFLETVPRPLMESVRRRNRHVPIEEFVFVGRRTGQERRLLLNLIEVEGSWYVGHPNGTSNWVRNLAAAGGCQVIRRDHEPVRVTATELAVGPERDAVVARTGELPAPAGFVYRRAARHIRVVGRFFRLTPIE
jgi:hypothetical protein